MARRAQQLVTALGFSSSRQPFVLHCGAVPESIVDTAISIKLVKPVADPYYPGETEIDYLRDLDSTSECEDWEELLDWEYRLRTELRNAGYVWEREQDSVRIWRGAAWRKAHPALL